MAPLAFASSFSGASLKAPPASRSYNTPRCEMRSDAVAPKISIIDTGSDGTSKVNIEWVVVPPNTADAFTVAGNSALAVSLRSKINTPALPGAPVPCPPGVAPADFYFPKDTRNLAPVIEFEYNQSISVGYESINPAVSGITANCVESTAFWKQPEYKYSAPEGESSSTAQETLSTTLYEKYYPSNIRNLAPVISMKRPMGDWDPSSFVEVATEFVSLDTERAAKVSVSTGQDAGAATAQKYYGDKMYMAPDIFIRVAQTPRLELSMMEVAEPLKEAMTMLGREPEPKPIAQPEPVATEPVATPEADE